MKILIALLFLSVLAITAAETPSITRRRIEVVLEDSWSRPTPEPGRNCSEHLAQLQGQKSWHSPGAWHGYPKCEPDGTYSALQVLSNSTANIDVQCVSKGGKDILRGPKIHTCKCPRERFEGQERSKQHMVGQFIPGCNDTTGEYSPRQFHGSTGLSWCADAEGNQIGEKKRGHLVGC